jgi:polyphosphate:AMP phosphotransferase
MFESAEVGHAVSKKAYEKQVPELRAELLDAQARVLDKSEFAVVLVLAGVDGGGTGDVANLLLSWIDPRHVRVHAYGAPSDEERARPPMWRYWRDLPPRGEMGVFFEGWYAATLHDRVRRRIDRAEMTRQLADTCRFERMLVDEGALVVKIWLHLTKKGQKHRFESLEASPATAWRVGKSSWKNHAQYDRFRRVSERALRATSTAEAPWIVVEATDAHYRDLTVGRALLAAMRARIAGKYKPRGTPAPRPPPPPPIDARNVLESLDLTKSLSDAEYAAQLPRLQGRLNALCRHRRFRDVGVVVAFEGNDAAGKGGTIRRVTGALDARRYDDVPIAAPTEEERAQPYLWRFWRRVPARGHFTIFDRTWYGRVLVERVEGLTPEPDWMRAYREIVDFEESLARSGIVVVKLWLAVGKTEQLARFHARQKVPFKRYKITPDDWRNRKKWPEYERAMCDMVDRTSTDDAPWHLVESNDKRWARVKVLRTLCDSLERALERA